MLKTFLSLKYIFSKTLKKDPEENCALFFKHIRTIRSFHQFKYAKIVLIIESNLGLEAVWYSKFINTFSTKTESGIIIMKEHETRGIYGFGVPMAKELKKHMAISFRQLLDNDMFKFHVDFFTTTENKTAADMKEEIIKQLKEYCIIIQQPSGRDKFQPPTERYSGKSGYGYDDLAITLQLGLMMKFQFFKSEKYKSHW